MSRTRTFKEFQIGDRVTFRKHEGTIVETFRDNGYPGYWVEFNNGNRFPYGANALTRTTASTFKPKDTTSGEIWGQEDGLDGDRLVRDTAIASEAKNQPLIKSKEAA